MLYVTTVCDVANHQIIDIVPSCNYVDVARFLHNFPTQWKNNITYATLDMSPTYRAVFNVVTPKATQIADHFHVITLANRALDSVRRRVQQLARTLKRWYNQIPAWHQAHLSNSITEAMNNLIKRTKRIGYGFTNFKNYRIRCLLYAGKLNWRLLNNIFP